VKNFVKLVMISFLAAVAVGCGSSEDFVFTNNNNGPANQGFQIQLSQAELAAMFPPTINQSIDPNIVNFHVFVFDAAGNQVGNTIVVPNNQTNLDVLITGLVIAHFDVVLAGVDANGNVVAAYEAEDIVVIPNDIKVIGSQVFKALDGFVLPDGQGGSGGGGGGEGSFIQGGTINSLEFSFDGNYNGDEPPVTASAQVSGALGEGEGGVQSLNIILTAPPNILTLTIVDPTGADLVVNQAYQVVTNDTDAGSVATLNELSNEIPPSAVAGYVTEGLTSSGTATITELTDTQVTVEFSYMNLVPNSEIASNPSTGTFDVSGSVTGQFLQIP